ncbi:MAG: SGNH/GDSL hydrolase family protein, partial [Ilumatobacteraceae bacterium]
MTRLSTFVGAALIGVLSLPAVAVASTDDAAAPDAPGSSTVRSAPTASPARTEAPAAIAVVGDSISQGTGSNGPGAPGGGIGSSRPAASWAMGDHAGLDSYVQRLEAARGRPVSTVDLSANGATIEEHLVDQVRSVPADTGLVLMQMGANDLCRSDVDDMTPLDDARAEIRNALAWLREHRPDTFVSVSS